MELNFNCGKSNDLEPIDSKIGNVLSFNNYNFFVLFFQVYILRLFVILIIMGNPIMVDQ